MEIKYDWTGALVPGPSKNWGLDVNPSWLKAIVPQDPGFLLLTGDMYYMALPSTDERLLLSEEYQYKLSGVRLQYGKDNMPHVNVRDLGGVGASEDDLVLLDDGKLGLREANSSRRLTDERVKRNVEVLQCRDRFCTEELAKLQGEKVALRVPRVSSDTPFPRFQYKMMWPC
ncbi:uncharacterized protein EI97DRAFT_458647 [Westerdykella ornata]|uniref:Uncharacterized protein n=1 Tax=Westerdykella ornata TaxID=318751 RepID=A0A6A6JIC3_WESOR|nr:uncharacterized protein EI97DRAFT_458647 [Westerdykella ornata]KAF2276157.1 hypothetical protein EI97DRAFT_458647 [Westerdykella ornata]